MEEHTRGIGELHQLIVRTDGHVLGLDQKVDGVRHELASHIGALDQTVDRFRDERAGRVSSLDGRLNARIDGLVLKISRQFSWLVGIQVAVLIAVIGFLVHV